MFQWQGRWFSFDCMLCHLVLGDALVIHFMVFLTRGYVGYFSRMWRLYIIDFVSIIMIEFDITFSLFRTVLATALHPTCDLRSILILEYHIIALPVP